MKTPFFKHIVFLTPGFAADELDTPCIPPLQLLVRELSKHEEVHVSIIAFQYPAKHGNYDWHGTKVYACGGDNKGFPARLTCWKRARNAFKTIHKKNPVDLVHSFWLGECAFIGAGLASKFELSHMCTLMGQDVLPGNRYLRWINFRKLYLVALSQRHAAQFEATSGAKADVLIPWGVGPKKRSNNTQRDIDVLGVGSLIPLKRYELFIETVAPMIAANPALKIVLIGAGPDQVKLEQLAQKQGIQSNFTFTGQLPREKVLEYMERSKVLLHTSSYESFGYVFSEALQAGMKVVSFSVGWAEASAVWTVVRDTSQLKTALQKSLSESGTSDAATLYRIDQTAGEYVKHYLRLSE